MSSDLPTDINFVSKIPIEEKYETATVEIDRIFEENESLKEKIAKLEAENKELWTLIELIEAEKNKNYGIGRDSAPFILRRISALLSELREKQENEE